MASYRQVSEPASAAYRLLAPETYENQRLASAQAVSRYSLSVAPDFARSTGRVGPIDGIIGLPTGVEVVAEPAV